MALTTIAAKSGRRPGPVGIGVALVVALLCALAAAAATGPSAELLLLASAGALAGAVLAWLIFPRRPRLRRARAAVARSAAADPTPVFLTDSESTVHYRNPAAAGRGGGGDPGSLVEVLGDVCAAAATLVFRLQGRAAVQGAASEELAAPRGGMRVAVHRLGRDAFVWRLDPSPQRAPPPAPVPVPVPTPPTVSLSPAGDLLAMNPAARELLAPGAARLADITAAARLRAGEVEELIGADGPVFARVAELPATGGRRNLCLLPEAPALAGPADDALFDALPVALLVLTRGGRIRMANRRARALLDTAEPVGRDFSQLIEGLGRSVSDWLDEGAQGRATQRPEVVRATAAEAETFLQVTLGRLVATGEVSLVAVLNDATALKTLEAQFVQSQKMQAIGQLAGGIAHDFNNLLTAISGHCDLLLRRCGPEDPDYPDIDQIAQNAERAAGLVSQLLAFSRKQTLRPEVLDPCRILAELTRLLNRLVGERTRLTLDREQETGAIRADKRQFEQVIMNLVVNARDALGEGGEIRVGARNRHLAETMRRDRAKVAPGEYVVITVSDDGAGIAPDKLPKIFEPFFTTKGPGEGTGLGLSTVYGIVKQSGAFIFAESELGHGASFEIWFPMLEEDARAGEAETDGSRPAGGDASAVPVRAGAARSRSPGPVPGGRKAAPPGWRAASSQASPSRPAGPPPASGATPRGEARQAATVLLVEDEAAVRAFAARALRLRGHTVIEAASGEDALARLADPDLAVDVFVTDVSMPGLDGPGWVRRALPDRPGAHVVFVSGYAEETFETTRSDMPQAVFLAKPFSLEDLAGTVERPLAPAR